MCPMCLTTAMLIAASVTSTGGLAAIAIRKFGMKNAVDSSSSQSNADDFDKRAEQ
jgi:hypothetical protein